jgi:hypothetical protein
LKWGVFSVRELKEAQISIIRWSFLKVIYVGALRAESWELGVEVLVRSGSTSLE